MIISDIGMPGEDGYEFIRKVRALCPWRGRSNARRGTHGVRAGRGSNACLGAGYQMHAAKPIEPADLTAVVASLASSAVTDTHSRGKVGLVLPNPANSHFSKGRSPHGVRRRGF